VLCSDSQAWRGQTYRVDLRDQQVGLLSRLLSTASEIALLFVSQLAKYRHCAQNPASILRRGEQTAQTCAMAWLQPLCKEQKPLMPMCAGQ
jgi:hypothetical protein